MSLRADVAVPARDRKRLERLCRHVARLPIAIDRLEALPDGRLAYRLKTQRLVKGENSATLDLRTD